MVAGKPDAYMSSIHADDVATAVVAALDVPSGIYNVCDDEPLTRRDALDAFAAAFDLKRLRTNPAWLLRLIAGPAADVADRVATRVEPEVPRHDRLGAGVPEPARRLGRPSARNGRRRNA